MHIQLVNFYYELYLVVARKMSKKSSRNANQPSRFRDYVSVDESRPMSKGMLVSLIFFENNSSVVSYYMYTCLISFLARYSIVVHSNNEEQSVPLDELENTSGLPLSEKEALIDTEIIWMYKKRTPYKATIVGIHVNTGMLEICIYIFAYIHMHDQHTYSLLKYIYINN